MIKILKNIENYSSKEFIYLFINFAGTPQQPISFPEPAILGKETKALG